MALTHMVFVGHTKDRLMESIRKAHDYPVKKIILVTGEQASNAEKRAGNIARQLKKELSPLYEVEIQKIDKKNIMRGASQIIESVMKEKAKGNEALINMTGSLRTFSIAGYIAGCLTRSIMITSIPDYDENNEEIGIEEIIEVPALPLMFLKPDQLKILQAIGNDTVPLEELILSLNPEIEADMPMRLSKDQSGEDVSFMPGNMKSIERWDERTPDFHMYTYEKPRRAISNERSRLIHHLKKFDEMGLIIREKKGKNVLIRLTDLGWMLKRAEEVPVDRQQ